MMHGSTKLKKKQLILLTPNHIGLYKTFRLGKAPFKAVTVN